MMKILNNRFVKFLCLCLIIISCFNVKSHADSNLYCRECGKKISSDSKFCMYCGTKVAVEEEPEQDCISFSRSERTVKNNFRNTGTDYNIFPYEMKNCCGCSFKYTANSNNSGTACTGMRDVYVRGQNGEEKHDDNSWIYVGSFEYPHDGETVTVDLRWQKTRVYAVAVIRHNLNSNCSFSASWGETVTFYVGEYNNISTVLVGMRDCEQNCDATITDSASKEKELEMVLCKYCNGSRNCYRCSGSGRNFRGKECNACNGDGVCPYCLGLGYVLGYEED